MIIKELSIIFPIYNEEERLKKSLYKITRLFKAFKLIKIEIILVNDGSTDKTHELISTFVKSIKKQNKNKIIYINYKKNRGKGHALKKGVKKATKQWILTCDIDFSTEPTEINKWIKLNYIKNEKDCYFGSRDIKKSKIKFRYYRKFIGNIFNIIVSLLFKLNVKDTQCGFKLYHKNYAKKIFSKLKERGYSHDVEIAILLNKNFINITELPIKWIHRGKSKVNIFYDGLTMIIKLLFIKLRY
jgi:dolichyl-phosphate beta-glucosyltransferase|tara:strand:- start:298 stop:1026 length:729 start_codon:yes stop_codon:yes gene_type:complete